MSRIARPSAPLMLAFSASLLFALGCSSGSATAPPDPAGSADNPLEATHVPMAVESVSSAGTVVTSPLMAVDIRVDPLTLEAELLPLRSVTAQPTGQKFVVNVMDLMTKDPCTDCLQVSALSRNVDGNLMLTLDLRHPIAAPDIPGGVGTASLHGNNVRGFVVIDTNGPDGVTSGDDPVSVDFTGFNHPSLGFDEDTQNVVAGFVANADGYSGDVTGIVAPGFDTVYPYIVFGADDGTVGTGNFALDGWTTNELDNPTGFNVFGQGSTVSGDFELVLDTAAGAPSDEVVFRLIITASYVVAKKNFGATGLVDPLDPMYFMPEGALQSAWRVTVDNKGTDGLGTPPREGVADVVAIDVAVRDWQQLNQATLVPDLTATTAVSGILGLGGPKLVAIDVPGVFATVPRLDVSTATNDGTELDPVIAPFAIINNTATPEGTYVGVVRVEDERQNNVVFGAGESHELYEVSGLTADLLPYNLRSEQYTYKTYQTFTYTVAPRPVSASIDYAAAQVGQRLVADARTSTTILPATIVDYKWVFDYTGLVAQFATPDATTLTPILDVTCPYPTAIGHTLGLQVTDDLARTDVATYTVTVLPARTPFAVPPTVVNMLPPGVTGLNFGTNTQDANDTATGNPSGGDNFLMLGNNLYATFYGTVGGQPGLYLVRSTNGGSSWLSPTKLTSAVPPQYGGSAITGSRNTVSGQDQLYVALGNATYYGTPGQPCAMLVFAHPAGGDTGMFPWTQTTVDSYNSSATINAALSPAIVANPNNFSEVHLVYGISTGNPTGGITRRWRIRASTTGVAGLAADAPDLVDAATGADSVWLTDLGSCDTVEIAQHRISEDIYIHLGLNQNSYVLRSTDHGVSYQRPLASISWGTVFHREGDLVLDSWLPDTYYISRNRRGASTGQDPHVIVARGVGGVLTQLASPRAASEVAAASHDPAAFHGALSLSETGALESYWTEALGPAGAGTFLNNLHIQGDLFNQTTALWSYHPDITLNGTNIGRNPSAEPATDGTVCVIWSDPAAGQLKFARG